MWQMDGEKETCGTPGEVCMYAPKGANTAQGNEAVLNMQKSAEVILAER